ncbi:Prophage CP4-57 regulatory protein AlpA [Photobacterium damselae subsp. piscicida]|uniref:Prophage CP4-57 regulatory protein AlpA n=1 Tax=Photobacterium damsela subsp. piscicida TaxID=38294 RepID=A0AAD1FLJ8_PHODP|nr:Prophage CP4-57 regulatory protein AlpA [Photobacterium damselae subsp. piscicida]GAW44164.1 Prophage CP4-57 regulatory protein [Photobacterium damselae subsp. piscicida]
MINLGCTHIMRGVQVANYFGCSLSSIYRKVSDGLLPPPIRFEHQSVAWLSSELETIMTAHICGYSNEQIKSLVKELTQQRHSLMENK